MTAMTIEQAQEKVAALSVAQTKLLDQIDTGSPAQRKYVAAQQETERLRLAAELEQALADLQAARESERSARVAKLRAEKAPLLQEFLAALRRLEPVNARVAAFELKEHEITHQPIDVLHLPVGALIARIEAQLGERDENLHFGSCAPHWSRHQDAPPRATWD
jgi:hypothetical protein